MDNLQPSRFSRRQAGLPPQDAIAPIYPQQSQQQNHLQQINHANHPHQQDFLDPRETPLPPSIIAPTVETASISQFSHYQNPNHHRNNRIPDNVSLSNFLYGFDNNNYNSNLQPTQESQTFFPKPTVPAQEQTFPPAQEPISSPAQETTQSLSTAFESQQFFSPPNSHPQPPPIQTIMRQYPHHRTTPSITSTESSSIHPSLSSFSSSQIHHNVHPTAKSYNQDLTTLQHQLQLMQEDKRRMEVRMQDLMQHMLKSQSEYQSYIKTSQNHMAQNQTTMTKLMQQLSSSQAENKQLLHYITNPPHNRQPVPPTLNPLDIFDDPHPTPNNEPVQSLPTTNLPQNTATDTSILIPDTSTQLPSTPGLPNTPQASAKPEVSLSDQLMLQLIENTKTQQSFLASNMNDSYDHRFPKFSGKPKEDFTTWYNQVLSVLATPKWSKLYDDATEEPIEETDAPPDLSKKLYMKLVLALDGEAQLVMMSKPHLRGKGLSYLKTLKTTYKRVLSDPQSIIKEQEFARPIRGQDESVNAFAARLIQTRKDLSEHVTISDDRMRLRFIMGLGAQFSQIQTNLKNLPNWHTTNIEDLIVEANEHLQTVSAIREQNKLHKKDPPKKPDQKKPEDGKSTEIDNDTKRKRDINIDLRAGIFQPSKFAKLVKKDHCVYHNLPHNSNTCEHIRMMLKEYPTNKYQCVAAPTFTPSSSNPTPRPKVTPPFAANQATTTPAAPTPTANKVNMSSYQEIDLSDLQIEEQNLLQLEQELNNLNDNVNPYSISCKHVKLDIKPEVTHSDTIEHTFVIDSGAYPHMCNDITCFSVLSDNLPANMKHVTLADGSTKSNIKGIGTVAFKLGRNTHVLQNVIYVPSLSTSLFSVKHHCSQQGCTFHVENNQATLAFPTFTHTVPIQDEIYMTVNPIKVTLCKHETLPQPITPPKPNTKSILKYKLSSIFATKPSQSTPNSAGFDIYASEAVTIQPKQRSLIKTNLHLAIPVGCYGRIAPRSGLSLNHSIDLGAGVIDNDYRGEVRPLLLNNGTSPYMVQKGDRVAQIIFEKYLLPDLQRAQKLSNTIRGEKGFGSTEIDNCENLPSHTMSLKLNQLRFNKKITIRLPNQTSFTKGKMSINSKNNYSFIPTEYPAISYTLTPAQVSQMIKQHDLLFGHSHLITEDDSTNRHSPNTTPYSIPMMRTIDRPIQNAPKSTSISIDQLRRGFGFRNVEPLIKEIKQTADHFTISTLDRELTLDIGETSSIDRPPRNTNPLPLPKFPGDVVHADIIFGSGTAIGGAKYALFLVDRATRHKYVYPLRNLKTDILPSFIKFFSDIGRIPSMIRTDFDHKLMGSQIEIHLLKNNCKLQSAPPELQSVNGVCERNWRTILKMCRSWLVSAQLPSNFWWFALKRATEVSNYIPIKLNGELTTPHQLVYNNKVDLRNLIPMFSVAYTSYTSQHSYDVQTVRTILVGKSDKSNALLFYHPATKKILTSVRYKLDEHLIAGPSFNLKYEGGMYFNTYTNNNPTNKPPTFPPNTMVYVHHAGKNHQAKVLSIPLSGTLYTLQHKDGSIHQHEEMHISQTNPSSEPHNNDPLLHTFPSWVQHNCKATLYLPNMPRPKHGYLIFHNQQWKFRPGHRVTNTPIDLPNLDTTIHKLLQSASLHRGHPPYSKVLQIKASLNLSQIVAKHVSAKGLTNFDSPTLINHHKLCKNDKRIWDDAYAEEYNGLQSLPAWTKITQSEYNSLNSKHKTILPTMAISTVKFDELGKPKRAKYRIVVLGNLDPHQWTKHDCYAPVLSLLEVRLLTALSIHFTRTLKSGDFKQAFVQAKLPPDENYVLKPPPGCPLTPANSYWLLQRTLYGLKRSPKHWYDKACKILTSIGLQQCPNAPCIFHGTIIPGKPPLYLGLYVDDFIYFSTDDEVEKEFESLLKQQTNVDFMGQVSHFLGIRFQWRKTKGRLQVHLSQEAFSENLIQAAGLHHDSTSTVKTPYRSGHPVDSIKTNSTHQHNHYLEQQMRSYVGSLLWLSQGTRPDLATITNILSKHQANPSKRHVDSAKFVIKYLKGSKDHGIMFDSFENLRILAYLNFPIPSNKITGITDANWGPQDQSLLKPNQTPPELEQFKTRSISGHIIALHGPLHWVSKRQKITARSSGEAEIYATDLCVRDIFFIKHIIEDLKLYDQLFDTKTKIYNDNMACVHWSKATTTKGLRWIQVKENFIREHSHLLDICHIKGSENPADLLSKEDKDIKHFTTFRDALVPKPFSAEQYSVAATVNA